MLAGRKLAILGMGTMGRALARGLVSGGALEPAALRGTVLHTERLDELTGEVGFPVGASNAEAVAGADVLLLCVKPARMVGLPRAVATELAAQTVQGAARMVLETGRHPAALKDDVTTPAGCTISALLALEDGKLRSVLARGVQEAARAAAGLGG